MMLNLEHVGISARDTIALKDWYVKLFNLKVVYDNKKEKPTYFLKLPDGGLLEIYPAQTPGQSADNGCQGIRHLAFGTDDIEKEYENLVKNNVEIVTELSTNAKGIKTVFFKDLEGNIIHFIQRPQPLC
ncbi:MAG: glyoxylase family protein [Tepidanaerobacteraceae bacterium]|nr:glyoxylase family protein [Tepidanaerobacteraceae bacterium]